MSDTTHNRAEVLEALKPFAEAYGRWTGGNAPGHFASSVCPADFRKASQVFATLLSQAAPQQEPDSDWRRLALQFDGHRMQAIGHLKALLKDPQAHAAEASKFLSAGPLSGEEVLAQRIAALAASHPQAAQPQDECGGCNGTGWTVRDPDIGTDQECFVCEGSGRYEDAAQSVQDKPQEAGQARELPPLPYPEEAIRLVQEYGDARADGDWPKSGRLIGEIVKAMRAAQAAPAVPDIKEMVNRFLGWPLPKDFCPDCGISFDGRKDDEWNKGKTWPIGTNLLSADQAKAMFEYCLAAAPSPAVKQTLTTEAQAAPEVDARDAERYRFIRDVPYSPRIAEIMRWQKNSVMDAEISAAISAQSVSLDGKAGV